MPTTRTTRSREKPEQIADELRAMIVSGQLQEGESLGREPDPEVIKAYRVKEG